MCEDIFTVLLQADFVISCLLSDSTANYYACKTMMQLLETHSRY